MHLKPWQLPIAVAAIVLPVVAGFVFAGPAAGLALGALAALGVVVLAARRPPRGPIEPAALRDAKHHLLIAVSVPLENPEAIEWVAGEAGVDSVEEDAEVLVLAPARSGFLDRWASDVRAAREQAQRNLVVTVAALARARVGAEARVGDADIVQAVEDQLRSFPATEVILVTGRRERDERGAEAARELRGRLEVPFRHLVLEETAGR